jgi:hypothetical protein
MADRRGLLPLLPPLAPPFFFILLKILGEASVGL